MHNDPARVVLDAVRQSVEVTDAPLLLAVSGGLDSMALLRAMCMVARDRIAAVATFDHGTGASATRAVRLVTDTARAAGLEVSVGAMSDDATSRSGREAAWRTERHHFLRDAGSARGARIVTAHTEDDQVETVLMRAMRGSGARGLAALYAESPIVRPLLGVRRTDIERFAQHAAIEWIDDPSNASRAHLRNRVRHDLLPALRKVNRGIDAELIALSRRAAEWRAEMDALVERAMHPRVERDRSVVVASKELAGYDRDSLAVLWGSLAWRAGLALDHRGTRRLAAFTITGRSGRVPLSGGWMVESLGGEYVLSRMHDEPRVEAAALPARGALEWGAFRFRVSRVAAPASPWTASLPVEGAGVVRAWTPGDRLAPAGTQPRRRVKRYLSDVGLRGADRAGWPVVVAGDDVVWIPGVRRSDAATDRSGRPVRHYVCERIDR